MRTRKGTCVFTAGEVTGEICCGADEAASVIGVEGASSVFAGALVESSCFGAATDAAGFGDLVFTGATGADGAEFVTAGAAEFDDGVCGGADFLSKNECIAAITSGV